MKRSTLPRADLKPHITAGGVLVRYDRPEDKLLAHSLVVDTVGRLGRLVGQWQYIPWRSCLGCNDPNCTYDVQRGYWIARFAP